MAALAVVAGQDRLPHRNAIRDSVSLQVMLLRCPLMPGGSVLEALSPGQAALGPALLGILLIPRCGIDRHRHREAATLELFHGACDAIAHGCLVPASWDVPSSDAASPAPTEHLQDLRRSVSSS